MQARRGDAAVAADGHVLRARAHEVRANRPPEVMRELVKAAGSQVLVGAGTVLNTETARQCLDAGAQFLVSPGFNVETVKLAAREGKLMMAGALTPTEIMAAWEAGSDFVKIFPCGQVGGAKYIKALKGPFPQIPFVPTGGVNLTTAAEFIELVREDRPAANSARRHAPRR